MAKIVCFGELMLRLSPPGNQRMVQAKTYNVYYGGAEANVAVSLSEFGCEAVFVTRLPENALGNAALGCLRSYGVDTSRIIRGGERLGIYFSETGLSQRASQVLYDRKGSAMQTAERGMFDWDIIFKDATWFHFSGITPALGENVEKICRDACMAAKAYGVKISCDLNYRKKLWSNEKAGEVLGRLCNYVDVCIANEEDAESVFGIKAEKTNVTEGMLYKEAFFTVAKKLTERFGFEKTAITLRESYSASDNGWSAILLDQGSFYQSSTYKVRIADRIGSGDAFTAGLIYGFHNNYCSQKSLDFAVAASCLKHTIDGDFNLVSVEEVNNLVDGNGSGRINR